MTLNLKDKQKLSGIEAGGLRAKGLGSKRLGKTIIKSMVKQYRKDLKGADYLKYAHFDIYEVLSLFIANNVLGGLITQKQLDDDKTAVELKKYGLKIYLGRHNELSMSGWPEEIKKQYKNKITTILCNTKIGNGFRDLLNDDQSLALSRKENADEDEDYDIGYEGN